MSSTDDIRQHAKVEKLNHPSPERKDAHSKLHREAAAEWFKEAGTARKAPLHLDENKSYTVHHSDCLGDIAARRLREDHLKVDSRSIHKEEERLRKLNGDQYHSLEGKSKKERDFLGDGWHLKIYDDKVKPNMEGQKTEVQSKPEAKPSTETKPAGTAHLDIPELPHERLAPHHRHHSVLGEASHPRRQHPGESPEQPAQDLPPAKAKPGAQDPARVVQPEETRKQLAKPESPVRPHDGTAIYDVAAHTVYLPNGERLEAHSGLGRNIDNPNSEAQRNRGVTPHGTYDLSFRGGLFHGVQALRLNPQDPSKMHGRDGILAHTYMLGPSGQSNGCLVFKDYSRFLAAYKHGEIKHIQVV
ncbi:MAG TPA: DUF2778 domain-containing protein [Oculatellaceae cyanobacterium]